MSQNEIEAKPSLPECVRSNEGLGITRLGEVLQAAFTRGVVRFKSTEPVLGLLNDEIADVRTCDRNRTGNAESVADH